MKKKHLWIWSIVSGLLFAASWPARGFAPLIFVAIIPLLIIEEYISTNKSFFSRFAIVIYTFPAFFIWNLLTIYWIKNATLVGGIASIFISPIFTLVFFSAFHIVRRNLYKPNKGTYLIIFFWMASEFLLLNWDLKWPWLNLGHVFGGFHTWVQWYEYTGLYGGTLWVLLVNLLLFQGIRKIFFSSNKKGISYLFLSGSIALIVVPIIVSKIIYANYTESNNPYNIVVVQPNIDPYTEKLGGMPYRDQVGLAMDLARSKVDSTTDLIVFPESAFQENIWEHKFNKSFSIDSANKLLDKYPKASIIAGTTTYRYYLPNEKLKISAREYGIGSGKYYDAFNSALFIENNRAVEVSHKSKLVAGAEVMPFSKIFGKSNYFAKKLRGIDGTLGKDENRKVYQASNGKPKLSAVICYESGFAGFYSEFVKEGAELMLIITNDGWWGDTPGYKQHFLFAPLRAIENRRSIARSGNTGISAFINQRGDISQATEYWVEDVISGTLNANDKLTFYSKYGDYLGRLASFLMVIYLLASIAFVLKNKVKSN